MPTPVKLQKITIKGLFDLFDHEIAVNQDEGVTVLLGPNGFGKTAILRMVNEILSAVRVQDCETLLRTVFRELTLWFNDGRRLRLKALRDDIRVHFIPTERLRRADRSDLETKTGALDLLRGLAPSESELSVTVLAKELSSLIEAIQADNSEIASALERSFPKRLVQRQRSHEEPLSSDAIERRLGELEAERARLIRLGILPEQGDADLPTLPIDEGSRVVLTSRAVLSSLPVSTRVPSGLNATLLTEPPCPASVSNSLPLCASHMPSAVRQARLRFSVLTGF